VLKLISEKISYKKSNEGLQVIILGKIERWKEALLTAWLLAWIFCGGVVLNEYLVATDRERRMVFIIFLIFWAYYLWRVGKTWMFRRGGNELIKVTDYEIILKRSFFTFGNSKHYRIDQMEDFKKIELSKSSFAYTFENSWWVLGAERLGFSYGSKFVKFGMQLSDSETNQLYDLIRKQIKRAKKSDL
jgi:hypothetical protein